MTQYGSLCSGIEAATVAAPAGWEPAWFAQFDPEHNYARGPDFPSAVLAHHYPTIPNLGDMMKLREQIMLGKVDAPDVLVGGPPCQSFSVSGQRRGLNDERGNLTLEYVEILNAIDDTRHFLSLRPCTAVYENVPGILSDRTNAFGCLLGALVGADAALETETGKWPRAGLVCGPRRRVAWAILDAQWFGVAQRRRRVWLVAQDCDVVRDSGERACPGQILSLTKSLRGDTPTRREAREGAAGDVAPRLAANGRAAGSMTQQDAENGAAVVTTQYGDIAAAFRMEAFGQYTDDGVAGTVKSRDYKDATDLVAFHAEVQADQLPTDARDTSVTDSRTTLQHAAVAHDMAVRRLTVEECEILMGFPRGYTRIPWRKKPPEDCPDGPRYKALGNSWAVPCARWVLERVANTMGQS